MDDQTTITLTINGKERTLTVHRSEDLLRALRRASYASVKYGCGTGDCGACTVLLDGQPVRACQTRATQVEGREVITVEALAPGGQLHPIQQAFVDNNGMQCGICTPAQILVAKALLDRNPEPAEEEIREALSGVLCRCTGYVKIIQAVQRAAAVLRGEEVQPFEPVEATLSPGDSPAELLGRYYRTADDGTPLPPLVISPPDLEPLHTVGKGQPKVDGAKLAAGRPVFTDDIKLEGMLYGALLTSPHAHAGRRPRRPHPHRHSPC